MSISDEIWNGIVQNLATALIIFALTISVPKYFRKRVINQYIELIRASFYHVEEFLKTMYRFNKVDSFDIVIFFAGIIIGARIESTYANKFLLIVIVVYFYWIYMIKSYNLLNEDCTEDCEFRLTQMIVYASYIFLLGIIIGVDFVFYTSFEQMNVLNFLRFIGLMELILSLYCLQDLYRRYRYFYYNHVMPVANKYKSNFPYIKINTVSGVIAGQLEDIDNKSIITLCENGKKKFVPWDKIVSMEASSSNEHIVFDNNDK